MEAMEVGAATVVGVEMGVVVEEVMAEVRRCERRENGVIKKDSRGRRRGKTEGERPAAESYREFLLDRQQWKAGVTPLLAFFAHL